MTKRSADIGKSSGTPRMGGERYRPYPASKDSGVEWLGQVPEHWEVKRLRFTVTKCQNGLWGDDPDGINDVACVRVADFDRVAGVVKMNQPTLRSVDPMILGGRRLRRNDLLLEKSGGGDNQPVGAVVINTYGELAICSNFIAQMPVQEGFDPRYLTYVHAAMYSARINTRSIKQNTGIQNLDSENYLNEVAAYPELLEQRAIAVFLDRETARIDALVAKKERLIELLQEKRTALINRAVTKGLDPDVPMKDSGVEWLGAIPVHWEVVRLKQASRVQGGFAFSSDSFQNDGVPIIRMNNIRRGALDFENVVRIPEHECKDEFALNEDDIIYGLSGSIGSTGSLGNFAVVRKGDTPAQLNQRVARFRPVIDRITDGFLVGALQTTVFYEQVLSYTTGTAQFNVSTNEIGNVRLALPSIEEQHAIAAFLDRETAKIDALVAKVREAIDCHKELRTALISAAVTGKIDVRQAAAYVTFTPAVTKKFCKSSSS